MALAPRRRLRSIWRYLRAEQRTLRQGLVALLVGAAAAFVAGLTLGNITGTLRRLPGLFILIPAAAGMQNTVFGAIGARLGTSTHVGVFEVTGRRSGVLYQNAFAGVVLTAFSSLYLAALAKLAALVFGLPSISFLDFVTISVVGASIGAIVILTVTVVVAVVSYRRGYDLDAVGTPLIIAAGDMTTIPALFLATLLVHNGTVNAVIASVAITVCVFATLRGALTDLRLARRAMLEMLAVVLLTPLLDILAGTVIEARLSHFIALPGLLVVIPPLISVAGDLGGVLSSRLSSKLHLGVISPRRLPEAPAVLDAGLVVVFGLVVFTAIGAAGFGLSALTGKASPSFVIMVAGTLLAGLVASLFGLVFAYYIAVATTRFGLNPDNHAVPIITSAMDLTGVTSFLVVLAVLGVTTHV
ncbi:MAG: magnesium transporter [Actinomycetota bacterium]